MPATPDVFIDCHCDTGENPLWHPDEQRLYWVDIPRGIIYRCDPLTMQTETFQHKSAIGGITLQYDGSLLLFMARGAIASWCDGTLTPLLASIPGEEDNRFNDVIAGENGHVFCGTMTAPSHAGRLYRLNADLSITPLIENVGTANGMGFTPDQTGMYFTDTRAYRIDLFDYDKASGSITNRRPFVSVDDGRGRPDGLTVDAEGCVWSARWDGYGLIRYDPDGREIAWFDLPARNVSSLTFGGPDYTDIYITTAIGKEPSNCGTHGGALFHMNQGIRGVPEFRSTIPA
ncbi:MAG: SMP-30/gluconolactonase/LRE family protein [Kiritimatiellae bacterium]|nr:SMP-30/gluconolactonase/LRE family protein [Kiritimatiellia bacterium]